jgi:hypothetical protein
MMLIMIAISIATANADDDAGLRGIDGSRLVISGLLCITSVIAWGGVTRAVAALAAVDATGETEGEDRGEEDFFHDGKFLRQQRGIITAPV